MVMKRLSDVLWWIHVGIVAQIALASFLGVYSFFCLRGTIVYAATIVAIAVLDRFARMFWANDLLSVVFRKVWIWLQEKKVRAGVVFVVLTLVNCLSVYAVITDQTHIRRDIERHFADEFLEVKDYTAPPVPIDLEYVGITINPRFQDIIHIDSRANCVFYLGPAGVGKSPALKQLQKSFGEYNEWNLDHFAAIKIKLYDLADGQLSIEAKNWGTNEGLREVSSVIENGSDVDFVDWFARSQSEELYKTFRRACESKEDYEDGIRDWFWSSSQKPNGILVIVDDLDEVGDQTLEQVLEKVRKTLENAAELKAGRVTIVLASRGEIAYFGRSRIERMHDLVNESNGDIALRAHLVRPLEIQDNEVLDARLWDSFYKLSGLSKGDKELIVGRWKTLLFRDKDELVRQATSFVDGANEVAKYLSLHQNFEREDFERWFYQQWWQRGEKHGLPPFGESTSYEEALCAGLGRIGDAKSYIDSEIQKLLLSGFIIVEPVRPIPNAVKVSQQFPALFNSNGICEKFSEDRPTELGGTHHLYNPPHVQG